VIDINRLLQRLCDADIDFVIVGGFAATLHGSSLVTRDLDVCAILSSESVKKPRDALRDLKPAHRQTSPKISLLDNPDPGIEVRNLYLRTDFGPVDILSSFLGVRSTI
jgi:molybdopterin-guanine dinucleotide biosynthesis protein